MTSRAGPAVIFAIAAACSPVSEQTVVRARAANDFRCGEERVQLAYVSGALYHATGCGKDGYYNCVGQGRNIRCTTEERRETAP